MKRTLLIAAMVVATTSCAIELSAQEISSSKAKHQVYRVVVLPPDGGPDS
jgi:hypothetical protein